MSEGFLGTLINRVVAPEQPTEGGETPVPQMNPFLQALKKIRVNVGYNTPGMSANSAFGGDSDITDLLEKLLKEKMSGKNGTTSSPSDKGVPVIKVGPPEIGGDPNYPGMGPFYGRSY